MLDMAKGSIGLLYLEKRSDVRLLWEMSRFTKEGIEKIAGGISSSLLKDKSRDSREESVANDDGMDCRALR